MHLSTQNILLVFLGGGLGSVLRFWLSSVVVNASINKPYLATLAINVLAALVLGILFYLKQKPDFSASLYILLAIGFCGGFSTFSTFTLEGFMLLTEGKVIAFILYSLGSVVLCLGALALGYQTAKTLV